MPRKYINYELISAPRPNIHILKYIENTDDELNKISRIMIVELSVKSANFFKGNNNRVQDTWILIKLGVIKHLKMTIDGVSINNLMIELDYQPE